MITIEVKIPKEVRAYKETIFFGLSCRQFICSLLAVGIAAGVFMLFDRFMNRETASWLWLFRHYSKAAMVLKTLLTVRRVFRPNHSSIPNSHKITEGESE